LKKFLYIFVLFLNIYQLSAQELNCNVQVLAPQVSNADPKIFQTLQTAIYEFLNNTKWTTEVFKNDERIDCSMLVNVSQVISTGEYKASIQIQSRRPVYKTSYFSPIINYNDPDFNFKYIELQALDFSENTYTSNLTSVLAFYAYILIGLDYDTFSPEGGTPYFLKAQQVVNNAQNSSDAGWKAFENNKNRYWLAENLLNANFRPLRQTLYSYHRMGLDIMSNDIENARNEILLSIEALQKVFNISPGSYLMKVFFDAKADEIVNIFSQAYPEAKGKVVTILNNINPANTTKYQKIQAGN